MNRKQMNLSEMLLTLEAFLTANLSSFEHKPAILSVIEQLKTKNAEIRTLKQLQSVSTEADYAIKDADEEALIATAVKVSDGLRIIAATTNNTRLKIESGVSQWDLGRLRKDDMYVRLKQLNATAQPFIDQLVLLGIMGRDVDKLETESTRLSNIKPIINNKKAKSTKATADLDQTLTDINTTLKETLDPLMLEFKLLNSNLYGEYLKARKINNRAAGRASKETPQS